MLPLNLDAQHTIEFGGPNPRIYGHWRDYVPEDVPLRLSGFNVETFNPEALFSIEQCLTHGIPPKEFIFICRK